MEIRRVDKDFRGNNCNYEESDVSDAVKEKLIFKARAPKRRTRLYGYFASVHATHRIKPVQSGVNPSSSPSIIFLGKLIDQSDFTGDDL